MAESPTTEASAAEAPAAETTPTKASTTKAVPAKAVPTEASAAEVTTPEMTATAKAARLRKCRNGSDAGDEGQSRRTGKECLLQTISHSRLPIIAIGLEVGASQATIKAEVPEKGFDQTNLMDGGWYRDMDFTSA